MFNSTHFIRMFFITFNICLFFLYSYSLIVLLTDRLAAIVALFPYLFSLSFFQATTMALHVTLAVGLLVYLTVAGMFSDSLDYSFSSLQISHHTIAYEPNKPLSLQIILMF